MQSSRKILIVEDERLIADRLRIILERLGYAVCGTAAGAEQAVALALSEKPALILMDVKLSGGRDGVDAAQEIRGHRRPAIVFVTGSDDSATLARIRASQPAAVLIKPVRHRELQAVLARLCPLP